jgi:DNA-binding NarL/FixJ family response regulator
MSTDTLKRPTRFVIVDDHEISRAGLRGCLEGCEDLLLVGEASDLSGAFLLVRQQRPDLVLLDVRLPDGDGIQALPRFRVIVPRGRLVITSIYSDEATMRAAMRGGADGYAFKGARREDLLGLLRSCVGRPDGQYPDPSHFMGGMDDHVSPDDSERFRRLTRRERQVAFYVEQGLSNTAIARLLNVASGTVKVTLERLLSKLELQNRTQVAAAVARYGSYRLNLEDDGSLEP